MKRALVLGGGGFIGGHLAKKLKDLNYWVHVVDIKESPEYWQANEICNVYTEGDLRDPDLVNRITSESIDEIYQLAADMGGAGYVFTGLNDANIMHNSAMINLNVAYYASKHGVNRIFYSSSACMYPLHNQLDNNNPNCTEDSAYPAAPDSEYGWEKLFSERLFLAFNKNYNLNAKIARFHNIYGPKGTWYGGREKAPAAMCRKALESDDSIEVWGSGEQTRSFMYIDDCIESVIKFMQQDDFSGPVNIGSEEMVSINELAKIAIHLSGKSLTIDNIDGNRFYDKYGYSCPIGVNGRNSDNTLFRKTVGNIDYHSLYDGMKKTFDWIKSEYNK